MTAGSALEPPAGSNRVSGRRRLANTVRRSTRRLKHCRTNITVARSGTIDTPPTTTILSPGVFPASRRRPRVRGLTHHRPVRPDVARSGISADDGVRTMNCGCSRLLVTPRVSGHNGGFRRRSLLEGDAAGTKQRHTVYSDSLPVIARVGRRSPVTRSNDSSQRSIRESDHKAETGPEPCLEGPRVHPLTHHLPVPPGAPADRPPRVRWRVFRLAS